MKTKIDLKNAPLPLLKALALSIARDIDRGTDDLRGYLEEIFTRIPDAKEIW